MTREEAIAMRLRNQQLLAPHLEKPEDVVGWLGMMQAQDYTQFRWAIGMRMREPKMKAVKDSFSSGRLLRLHLLRCTVQVVTAEDYPWMLELCSERNLRTILSWPSYNQTDYSEQYHQEATEALKEILSKGRCTANNQEATSTNATISLSKKEISEEMSKLGLPSDTAHLNPILLRGEIEGLLCSGEMKGKDATWALAANNANVISITESLALLARKYFRSHSPASFEDFCWWTGLTITQNRQAIKQIASELEEVQVGKQEMYIYQAPLYCASLERSQHIDSIKTDNQEHSVHLLPPYDEYLIGYKSRWIALDKKYEAKAHNRFGIFKPVILLDGKAVGNWKASLLQGAKTIETDIFTQKREMGIKRLEKAKKSLQDFTTSR